MSKIDVFGHDTDLPEHPYSANCKENCNQSQGYGQALACEVDIAITECCLGLLLFRISCDPPGVCIIELAISYELNADYVHYEGYREENDHAIRENFPKAQVKPLVVIDRFSLTP